MPASSLASALPAEEWSKIQDSVDRALAWLATQQAADGSFPTLPVGQPDITSLSVMAFLSRGYMPGYGPYGQQLNRAIDFVLACQMDDGLFSYETPEPIHHTRRASGTASYNHAIAGLMLGEVYGHVTGGRAKKVRVAIEKAVAFTRALQTRPKPFPEDAGGVRYLRQHGPGETDADLSVTAWHLMFLRSARNAEFRVPQNYMDEAIGFVKRCWDPPSGMFNYMAIEGGISPTRGTTGAGILSLSMAGMHNTPMARAAGDWLVRHPYRYFGEFYGTWDKYYYSAYYCSQAAAQLGGRYWEKIYPPMVDVFLQVQYPDGSFPLDPRQGDAMWGKTYSTAMAVLAMTPAYQLLPVYQR
jgi:prenyltransferase beta subunit